MTSSIELYKKMASATDDEARAHIIAEAFEERYPNLSDVATKTDLSETELRLTKEIEEIRGKLEETRGEIKATELRLTKEIAETKKEIGRVHVDLTRAMHHQTLWVVGLVSAIIGLLRFLDMVTG